MAEIGPACPGNRLLLHLSEEDWNLLNPWCERVELPMRFVAFAANMPIEYVYFPESSIGSIVASGGPNDHAEIGLVGHEGVTGVPIILGTDRSPHQAFVQVAGQGWRLPAKILHDALHQSSALRSLVIRRARLGLTQF